MLALTSLEVDPVLAECSYLEGDVLIEAVEDLSDRVRYRLDYAYILVGAGLSLRAGALLKDVVRLAQTSSDDAFRIDVLYTQAEFACLLGLHAYAVQLWSQLIAQAPEGMVDPLALAGARANRALDQIWVGALDDTEEDLRVAADAFHKMGHDQMVAWLTAARGDVASRRGDYARAGKLLAAAGDTLKEVVSHPAVEYFEIAGRLAARVGR